MTDNETHPALALQAPAPLATTANSVDILQTIAAAIQQGPPADELEKYLAVAERLDAKRAEREFNKAFIAFKRECPPIPRDVEHGGITVTRDGRSERYRYADIDTALSHVRPYLVAHGLDIRFGDVQIEGEGGEKLVRQSAILIHEDGHSVSASFACPPDSSNPRMSARDRYMGAETTAQRRALSAVLGMKFGDPPSEPAEPPKRITPKQVAELVTMLDSDAMPPGTRERLLAHVGVESLDEIPAERFASLKAGLDKKLADAGASV